MTNISSQTDLSKTKLYKSKKKSRPKEILYSGKPEYEISLRIQLTQKLIQFRSGISFLALSKKKRPEGLFQLAVTPVIAIFINSRRNEIEIILFAAGIAESLFSVREIDNPVGFVDFLIAFWASRRKFREHDFRVTGVGCMAHNASSGVKVETSEGT